jgi:hypothetical protein
MNEGYQGVQKNWVNTRKYMHKSQVGVYIIT